MNSHVALPGCLGPLFWVLFAGKSRNIHCGCPSLEGSSSPWHAQRGIKAWNSFGFFPRVSRVYLEKFRRSSEQCEVIKWTRVPPSYHHFLRSWRELGERPLCLGGVLPVSPLQPGPLLARCDLQLCHLFILLFAYSLNLICLCFMSLPPFPHFFQFPPLRMVPWCHFYFHTCEMAFLDPYVLSFLLWATPWRHPLFSLLISTLFSSPSEAILLSQITFIYSQSMNQIEPSCRGRKCAHIIIFHQAMELEVHSSSAQSHKSNS